MWRSLVALLQLAAIMAAPDTWHNLGGFEVCGGDFRESSGTVESPFYPRRYAANVECNYKITVEAGHAVRLCFQDFELEGPAPKCSFDYLEIRDGRNENATLIGRYCGRPSPISECITSKYNYLWMTFKTDYTVQDKGFSAKYSSIDIRNIIQPTKLVKPGKEEVLRP